MVVPRQGGWGSPPRDTVLLHQGAPGQVPRYRELSSDLPCPAGQGQQCHLTRPHHAALLLSPAQAAASAWSNAFSLDCTSPSHTEVLRFLFLPHQQAPICSLREHSAGSTPANSIWWFLITLTVYLLLSLTSLNSTYQWPTATSRQLFVPIHYPKARPTKANIPSLYTRWFMYVYICSMYTLCFQTARHLPVPTVLSQMLLYQDGSHHFLKTGQKKPLPTIHTYIFRCTGQSLSTNTTRRTGSSGLTVTTPPKEEVVPSCWKDQMLQTLAYQWLVPGSNPIQRKQNKSCESGLQDPAPSFFRAGRISLAILNQFS